MTVQELIIALSEIEDKSKPIFMDVIDTEVIDVFEFDSRVVIFDY